VTVYVERNINMIRLDKFLSEMGLGTRSEVKKLIKTGQIAINGTVAAKPETKVDTDADEVSVNGRIVKYQRYEYYLFNKPSGFAATVPFMAICPVFISFFTSERVPSPISDKNLSNRIILIFLSTYTVT
jgi:16S rRNA U516 pseudouridylate synthase RsuA-like enzyme